MGNSLCHHLEVIVNVSSQGSAVMRELKSNDPKEYHFVIWFVARQNWKA